MAATKSSISAFSYVQSGKGHLCFGIVMLFCSGLQKAVIASYPLIFSGEESVATKATIILNQGRNLFFLWLTTKREIGVVFAGLLA